MGFMASIDETLLRLVEEAGPGRSVDPQAVARAHDGENWRRVLPQVKAAAVGLARQGRVVILRHGKPVEPEGLKGVWRVRAP